MAKEFKVGCRDCKHFKRGSKKRGGIVIIEGKMFPKIRVIDPKCELHQERYEAWLNENEGKDRMEYTSPPDCFVANKGLQYVWDDLKKHEDENKS